MGDGNFQQIKQACAPIHAITSRKKQSPTKHALKSLLRSATKSSWQHHTCSVHFEKRCNKLVAEKKVLLAASRREKGK